MSIGKKLLSLRKQEGISQQELASYLHVTRQTISKFEHDLSLPDMDSMIKICEYYHITLNELLGIEEDMNDVKKLYNQIQLVADNIQKNNKKTKILNIVLIIICIISLFLSLFMVNRIQSYDQIFQSLTESNEHNAYFQVNSVNNEHQLFLGIDNNETYMNIEKCNLDKQTITLDYQFILREYTKDTIVSIEFINHDDKQEYTLNKKNNIFTFHKEIPLNNYTQVYLIIDNGQHIVKENLGSEGNCDYMSYILQELSYLYIPVDENNHLICNQIVFDPEVIHQKYDVKGNFQNGSLIVEMYKEDGTCLINTSIPLKEGKTVALKDYIPLKEDVYISITACFKYDNGTSTYGLFSHTTDNKLSSSFQVNKDNEKYVIYPR